MIAYKFNDINFTLKIVLLYVRDRIIIRVRYILIMKNIKNFTLGFIAALVFIGIIYWAYPLIFGIKSNEIVPPDELKHGSTDIGTLKVEIFANGAPLSGVEVYLGTIGDNGPVGPMSIVKTNEHGLALFEPVPAGTYDIFWNAETFPQGYNQPPVMSVEIARDKVIEKVIELIPK